MGQLHVEDRVLLGVAAVSGGQVAAGDHLDAVHPDDRQHLDPDPQADRADIGQVHFLHIGRRQGHIGRALAAGRQDTSLVRNGVQLHGVDIDDEPARAGLGDGEALQGRAQGRKVQVGPQGAFDGGKVQGQHAGGHGHVGIVRLGLALALLEFLQVGLGGGQHPGHQLAAAVLAVVEQRIDEAGLVVVQGAARGLLAVVLARHGLDIAPAGDLVPILALVLHTVGAGQTLQQLVVGDGLVGGGLTALFTAGGAGLAVALAHGALGGPVDPGHCGDDCLGRFLRRHSNPSAAQGRTRTG